MTASPIDAFLARLHQGCLSDRSGAVATTSGRLALLTGIVITTVGGHRYEVGDSRDRFTIQSM